MSISFEDPELVLLYAPALLASESTGDYCCVRDAIEQQLMPRDFVEHMLVADFVHSTWETMRLRGYKAPIVKSATIKAITNLLKLQSGVYDVEGIDDLARRWFTNKSVRRKILAILRGVGLDESDIAAEAFRLSMADTGEIDRRLTQLESRREKILQRIEDRRAALATRIDATSDQRSNSNALLSLERGAD